METRICYILYCNDGKDTVNPALPGALHVSDGNVNENLPKKRDFVTA